MLPHITACLLVFSQPQLSSQLLLPPAAALCLLILRSERHQPIPNPLPADMGPSFFGYIAIFTLTVSLISFTMFSSHITACLNLTSASALQQLTPHQSLPPAAAACLLILRPHRHQPIPNPLSADMRPNFFGYVAIFTLTVSLMSSTMFSSRITACVNSTFASALQQLSPYLPLTPAAAVICLF
jgi:ABC-type lipoprotein release transport system permease subunit